MINLKVKIITGFSEDQKYTIDAEEAHKAYYLFNHPEARGVFNNGLALVGKHIQAIQPDYNATMGWNRSYKLDDYDWDEIRGEGIDNKIRDVLQKAKITAENIKDLSLLKIDLSKISEEGVLLLN